MLNDNTAVKTCDVLAHCSNQELTEIEAPYLVADENLEILLQEYRELHEDVALLTKKLQKYREMICQSMGENEVLIGAGGEILATWKRTKPITRFNQSRLKEAMPDVYEAFKEVSEPQRRFNVL